MTTIQTNHESAGGGIVDRNLPCWGCGYNLRSIAHDKACPECGASVSRSLQGDRLVFSDRRWLRRLVFGINWILAATVISLSFMTAWLARSLIGLDLSNFVQVASLINWGLLLVGVFLVTWSEFGRGSKQGMFRHLARWLSLTAAVCSITLYLVNFGPIGVRIPLYTLRHIITTLGSIALFMYLGLLAGRAGRSGLLMQTYLLSAGYVVSLLISMLINTVHMLANLDIISYQSMTLDLLHYMSFVNMAIYLGLLLWLSIILIMLRRCLKKIIKLARNNDDMQRA